VLPDMAGLGDTGNRAVSRKIAKKFTVVCPVRTILWNEKCSPAKVGAMSEYTSFLFARSSFLEGVGRVLDLGATMTLYNTSPSAEVADARALLADRLALAADSDVAWSEDHVEPQEAQG